MRDKTIFSISCIINENSTQESAGCRGIREKWYFFKRFFALFLCKDSYDDQANVIRKYMKDVVKGGGGGYTLQKLNCERSLFCSKICCERT